MDFLRSLQAVHKKNVPAFLLSSNFPNYSTIVVLQLRRSKYKPVHKVIIKSSFVLTVIISI